MTAPAAALAVLARIRAELDAGVELATCLQHPRIATDAWNDEQEAWLLML